ncbi:MAG: CBS domain-containing protein [Chthoniobacterales bacterium]|nr:CBS domain-containing protein [Chthoniobacterales bacterium]
MTHQSATEIAAKISRVLAVLLGIFGLVSQQFFLLAIAFFIYMAVASETQAGQFDTLLRGLPVRRLMNRAVKTVSPDLALHEFIQAMLRERHIGFPVVDPATKKLVGMVHLSDIQGKDSTLRVADVMTPDAPTIRDDADAMAAFKEMGRRNFGRLVVVDAGGAIVGIISKTDLINVIKIRAVSEGVPSTTSQTTETPPVPSPSGRGLG